MMIGIVISKKRFAGDILKVASVSVGLFFIRTDGILIDKIGEERSILSNNLSVFLFLYIHCKLLIMNAVAKS